LLFPQDVSTCEILSHGEEVSLRRTGPRFNGAPPKTTQENRQLSHGRNERPRSRITYVKHALLHPYNLPVLVVVMTIGAISGNLIGLLLAALAEVMVLTIISRLGFFRRHIEEMLQQAERMEAAKTRTQLLLRMDEKHRQELEHLELLVDRTRNNLSRSTSPIDPMLDDCLGLGRLTMSYVRLAIAYKRSHDSLHAANREALEAEIAALERASEHANDRLRQLTNRRLMVAKRRAERWDKTREDLDAIVHQLAMVRELIHLMHEHSVAAVDLDETSCEIEQFSANVEATESMVRDIAELSVDDGVDHRVLQLGRTHISANN
jgi:hypothetical protein